MQKLNVREFGDYRSFLWAYAQWKKNSNPRWSLGGWSKNLGLKNTSSISKVLKGQRHIGPEMTKKMLRYFDFNEKDRRYFSDLVRLSKFSHKDPELGALLVERVLRSKKSDVRILGLTTFRLFSDWYCFAIREIVNLPDFREDTKWIKKRLLFSVNENQIVRALKDLEEVGLLRRNSDGALEQADDFVATSTEESDTAICRYHSSALSLAKDALSKVAREKREFRASTFLLGAKDAVVLKQDIRDFQDSVLRRPQNRADNVELYQLQIQLYPLTRKENKS